MVSLKSSFPRNHHLKSNQKKRKEFESLFRSAMAPVTAKVPKEGKTKKTALATKKPRAYPTFYEMVSEAIMALKERTGSSQIAIAKFIEEKQKADLPNNFKKLLLVQLKKLVANDKLVKVKNSFKLPPKSPATSAAAAVKKLKSPSTSAVAQKPKSSTTTATAKKPKSSSTTAVAKKPKSASAKDAAKKPKSASASDATKKSKSDSPKAPAAKKRKASVANDAAKKPKVEGKKTAVTSKAKKPKSIKSPAKKVEAKKGKK